MQRFFALIELANAPFIFGQGPHSFTAQGEFIGAANVTIRNGRLGRASHHGIHGNMNENIVIEVRIWVTLVAHCRFWSFRELVLTSDARLITVFMGMGVRSKMLLLR